MEPKTDCFAYGYECEILIELNCDNCPFYKTQKEKLAKEVEAIKILANKGYAESYLKKLPGYQRYLLEVQR